MQQVRMRSGRRGWFSDEVWWAADQVVDVAEDVAAYLVDAVGAAEYVPAVQAEPLKADEPVGLASAPTPTAAATGKGRRKSA